MNWSLKFNDNRKKRPFFITKLFLKYILIFCNDNILKIDFHIILSRWLSQWCPNEPADGRESSERAYLKIQILSGDAWLDSKGAFCDDIGLCDSFIKVRVNGVEVFNTPTVYGSSTPEYDATYITDDSIPKNSNILIQMWDYDRIGPKDLMSEWTLAPSSIGDCVDFRGEKGKKTEDGFNPVKRNGLRICSHWIDD